MILRSFLIRSVGIYLCAALPSLQGCALEKEAKPQQVPGHPNVLFIAVDDMNDWIGPLGGYPDPHTPNLDRLAAMSQKFTRAYCSAPLCNPSRASLMTGILPSTSGVYDNPDPWRVALPDAVTIPQYFSQHGYKSIGRGKIYHGGWPDVNPGAWDFYIPKLKDADAEFSADEMERKKIVGKLYAKALDIGDAEMDDFHVASWTAEQLSREHDKPFFLACGIYKPHLTWWVPKKYFDLYPLDEITLPEVPEDDLDDLPPIGREIALRSGDHASITKADYWREAVQGYLASISFADAQIGRVLDALESGPNADNTIVVLWSDHGWHLGEKGHWRKFALWEEATRVVLMIAAPGMTKRGSACAKPVTLADLYPTLVELCNLPTREGLEGQSLVPLLKNPKEDWERPALTTFGRNRHALRTERWRYIRYNDGSEELYDHDDDPMEWKNLASDPNYRTLIDDLAQWLPTTNAPVVPPPTKEQEKKYLGDAKGWIGTDASEVDGEDRVRRQNYKNGR